MTTNQIAYAKYLEDKRHNEATETETNRSNLAKEIEANRSNVAQEHETNRSNIAKEIEVNRHNVSTERLDKAKFVSSVVKDVTGLAAKQRDQSNDLAKSLIRLLL